MLNIKLFCAGTLTFGAGSGLWDGGSLVIDTASSADIAFALTELK